MDAYDEKSQTYLTNKRQFADFINRDADQIYKLKIKSMIDNHLTRLLVNLSDLRAFDPELTTRLLRHPMHFLSPFQSALKEYVYSLPVGEAPTTADIHYTIGIDGHFGSARLSPRQLHSIQLGTLVCIEGIATRCSIVRPKVQKTVHFCEKTSAYNEMVYHDSTSITGFPTSSIYPTKDIEGNPLTTEFGLSTYQDHQTLVIQEMPERAPAGLLPSSVDVVLDDDLVDSCKPGDRIAIIGIYRALPSKSQGFSSGIFRTVLIANHVRHLGKSISGSSEMSTDDLVNIRALGKRKDIFELLGRSVAPSIFGHEFIKKAIVLLLLGGVEKNLANGTHIRGDINMLFVGDPSTAKSQLLRFILNIAPLALNTTGRGSSGVGLTAAVTQDKETGERRLEAGAMVLADRGVVCIDEFDKMSDADRVAIHEVMEQQTVTIAKAGIHMSLNARCSVVAAANPRYSQYDSSKPPAWNVNLPDSLLSRFDFLFIILDTPEAEHDREVADKVLSNHRYIKRGGEEMEEGGDEKERVAEVKTDVFQKFDKLLHGGLLRRTRATKLEILSMPFMKKYLEFTRNEIQPVLTIEAAEYIGRQYAEMRNKDGKKDNSFPVTARSLETLIRLSTAHAKARQSEEVEEYDCVEVMKVLKFALEHDTGVVEDDDEEEEEEKSEGDVEETAAAKKKRQQQQRSRRAATERKEKEDADMQEEEEEVTAPTTPSKRKRTTPATTTSAPSSAKRRARSAASDSTMADSDETDEKVSDAYVVVAPAQVVLAQERIDEFRKALVAYMRSLRADSVQVSQIIRSLNSRQGSVAFDEQEVDAILAQLEAANAVMYRNGIVYRV